MTGSHSSCIAQDSLLLPLVGRGRVSVLLRPRSRWGRLSIIGLVGRYPANHLMLRERIPPRGSPLGLPPTLTRGGADATWDDGPRPSPHPRQGGSATFGDRAVGRRRRARRPYVGRLSPRPRPYRTFGAAAPEGATAPLATSGGHLLTCYSPVCHGQRQSRAFGPPRPDPGGSAPKAIPRRRDARSPPKEGPSAATAGDRLRRHRGLPVGVTRVPAPKGDGTSVSPRAGRGDSPERNEAGTVLTWRQAIRLACIKSFTSLYAAQRLNASTRIMPAPTPPVRSLRLRTRTQGGGGAGASNGWTRTINLRIMNPAL